VPEALKISWNDIRIDDLIGQVLLWSPSLAKGSEKCQRILRAITVGVMHVRVSLTHDIAHILCGLAQSRLRGLPTASQGGSGKVFKGMWQVR
jgi:hypothetical protein